MASAEDDNFDIDIYGEDETTAVQEDNQQEAEHDLTIDEHVAQTDGSADTRPRESTTPANNQPSTDEQTSTRTLQPQQGTKRKSPDQDDGDFNEDEADTNQEQDERPIDPGATHALLISDLHWYTTEDEIRGWAASSHSESELRDLTFSEHKVNGKSKGQCFLEFDTPQAATAMKREIESQPTSGLNARKHTLVFHGGMNPFKTLPKDGAGKVASDRGQRAGSAGYGGGQQNGAYNQGGFRGGRGGYQNNRGNMNGGAYNANRGGYGSGYNSNNNMNGGFQGGQMGFNRGGGFQNNNNFRGGFQNNMRGRGGMGMGMPMGGMGMGMPMMNPMMAGMGGFGGGFNPAAAMMGMNGMNGMGMGGQGPMGGFADNPHGQKRPRQDQ